ncbi:MAG TPA: NADH-ubiquinone oxidoreductase-F iron-sulfur binding region domain-containing protein [Chitinispirillaceae bacterium]|nr:NADH-ubiquinone oxidoreductase-F iron-sulfur binding region domain-containing protein [Chitinispirillaceae bacterium]
MPADTLDIRKTAEIFKNLVNKPAQRVIICAGTGCMANGAQQVIDTLEETIKREDIPVTIDIHKEGTENSIHISKSGCQGFCQMGPLVTILPQNILYTRVKPSDVEDIVTLTLQKGEIIDRLLYRNPSSKTSCKSTLEIPFYMKQTRTVLSLCGIIDPEDIHEYIYHDGYSAAQKAYKEMSQELICKQVSESGLRGRGGGGFLTGRKWDLARIQPDKDKFLICNGDEGDPGAFMDRSVMEGNPHSIIEGMLIAAYATGANIGYIYVRAEYPLAVKRLTKAVEDARTLGILGDKPFGTERSFNLHVMEGAGAFVCGEETALMASIEGNRGMPKPKPPFPAQSGLWGKPTIINNIETLASVPIIIRNGADEFRKIGTAKSPGTKTFALTGHVANTGLIEVPFGTTLREIVFNIGGGVTDDNGEVWPDGFKAVQIGGPSGGCLTEKHLDLPLDFDSLKGVGAMVGSGGLVVMNKNTCMVSMARFFMQFTQNESCGKCVLCREGTKQLLSLLDDIMEGNADKQTLDTMIRLAKTVQKGSLCGLGKSAPNPVLSMYNNFRDEYETHVFKKRCPVKQCTALSGFTIIYELCKGCGLCARKCPVDAIEGKPRQPFTINQEKCIKCGACIDNCKFNAVVRG